MSSARLADDSDLQTIIGTSGRPLASSPPVVPPHAMPGEEGLIAGLRNLVALLRGGVAAPLALRERYGELYRVQFIHRKLVAVWDADLVHQIAQNADRVWSTALGWDALTLNGLDPEAGNLGTLLNLDFEDHKLARKIVQPAFTLKAIEGHLLSAGRIFDEVLPTWLARGRVDFKAEGRTLLARVATDIFLGYKDPAETAEVDRALADVWRSVTAVSRNPLVSPSFKRARSGMQALLRTLRAMVPRRRKEEGTDVFSLLCRGAEPSEAGDDALVRLFAGIMMAAYDTTWAALSSMAYLLAKHPDWQQRLREELATVSQRNGGALDGASMKNLRQTEWAWKETLRLMPLNNFLPRVALRDVELAGYPLRAGTFVAPMTGAIGRHPKWWKEPNRFDPERFSPERAEDRQHPALHLPFGAGAHACIGMQLATMEVKLFWQKLLGSCSFTLEQDYDAQHKMTPLGSVSGTVSLRLRPERQSN